MSRTRLMDALRPRLNTWRAGFERRLGPAALLALVLLAAAAAVAAVWRPSLAAQQGELARQRQALLQRTPAPAPAAAAPHEAWMARLPVVAQRGEQVARLLALVGESEARVQGADYVAEAQAPGLLRLRVTLPVQGRYAQLRALVARLLDELPCAALDALALERPAEEAGPAGELSGRLRLSLFFRQEAP